MSEFAFWLNLSGAVLSTFTSCTYGVRIWRGKEEANLATWLIFFLLNVLGLLLAYEAGNPEPYVQMSWCITALFIVAVVWRRKGAWVWTRTETTVLIACVMAALVWCTIEAVLVSLVCYLAASYLATWPQARDYFRRPEVARRSAWVWIVNVVTILFPLAAKLVEQKYGAEHTLMYIAFFIPNALMAMLCLRRVRAVA